MRETSKSRRLWGAAELSALEGRGLDIGGGEDCLANARRFDVEDGDANEITRYVTEQFDFVYSSHCLEHMRDPRQAILGWWQLVKPGGHLVLIVPDEDLYEQGVFPSRFNPDHKATFTVAKRTSWSPVSINVLDLARSLPAGEIVSVQLQDDNYDRRLYRHGPLPPLGTVLAFVKRVFLMMRRRFSVELPLVAPILERREPVDQTLRPDVVAQIQCIVRKTAAAVRSGDPS
jgi:SAM-dependent methyltransferase